MKNIKFILGVTTLITIMALNFRHAYKGYGMNNSMQIVAALTSTSSLTDGFTDASWYDYFLYIFYTGKKIKTTEKECPTTSVTSSITTTTTTNSSSSAGGAASASATSNKGGVSTTVDGKVTGNASGGTSTTTTNTTTSNYVAPKRKVKVVTCEDDKYSNDDCTATSGDPCNPGNNTVK